MQIFWWENEVYMYYGQCENAHGRDDGTVDLASM